MKKITTIGLILSLFCGILISQTFTVYYADAQASAGTGANDSGVTAGTGAKPTSGGSVSTLKNPLKVDSIGQLINFILDGIAYISVIFGVGVIIWIGFKLVLAQGNPSAISEALNWLKYALIGIALILGARLMISIVLETLKGTGAVDQRVINSANNALNGGK